MVSGSPPLAGWNCVWTTDTDTTRVKRIVKEKLPLFDVRYSSGQLHSATFHGGFTYDAILIQNDFLDIVACACCTRGRSEVGVVSNLERAQIR